MNQRASRCPRCGEYGEWCLGRPPGAGWFKAEPVALCRSCSVYWIDDRGPWPDRETLTVESLLVDEFEEVAAPGRVLPMQRCPGCNVQLDDETRRAIPWFDHQKGDAPVCATCFERVRFVRQLNARVEDWLSMDHLLGRNVKVLSVEPADDIF